ncbi:sulfite exporter TauE/SafE family protein [Candidatus Woesearchaeota archaeon]|nr:sulfite exporter TauE/SafE family protein [Candidatus Woesearchaeota archaeon]
MEPISILIIAAIFFTATFYGSMVGGAGLITIPTLIFFGLSPHMAIGTNKVCAFGTTVGATFGYGKEKKIDYKSGFVFMFFLVIGAVIGSMTVLSFSEEIIKKFIGIVMIVIALFLLLKGNLGVKPANEKRNLLLFALFALGSGFYNGFYGAGIGIINRFVLSAFFAYAMVNSAALSTFGNIGANIFSIAVFAFYGAIEYSVFLPILLASLIGAYLGSKYAVKLGNVNIKRILLALAIIMAIKLLFF